MKKIAISDPARVDIRRIDREVALRILEALTDFARTGEGDVKYLTGQGGEKRLRVGNYRVRFTEEPPGCLAIHSVKHRRDAYRS